MGIPWKSQNTKSLNIFRKHLDNVLTKSGPFTDPDFVPGIETITGLETSKVLLVRSRT